MDLEKQPKLASRRSYIERVKEITKNSRKQEADIEQILKDTRELQLESNSIQERLHRTYAVVDELVFRYKISPTNFLCLENRKITSLMHPLSFELEYFQGSKERCRREAGL